MLALNLGLIGLPQESREGSAVPAPSQFRKLGSEKRGPPRVLACVSGATWRGFSQPVKSRLKLAPAPHVRLHVEAPPRSPAPSAQPPSPHGRPPVDQALCHSPPRWSGWELGSCSQGGAPRCAQPVTMEADAFFGCPAWLQLWGPTAGAALRSAAEPGPPWHQTKASFSSEG